MRTIVMHKTLNLRALAVALLLLAFASLAQADSVPTTLRSVATNGGGALSAGDYALVGAIGQPLAGTLQAGDEQLTSGIGVGWVESRDARVYVPMINR